MKKSLQLSILLGVALFLLSACTQVITETEIITDQAVVLEPADAETISEEATIEITSSGFSPSTLTIAKGTTVNFVNKDANNHWPASAVHPSHTEYPTTGGCSGSTFDACKGLAQGEIFIFTFDEAGEWSYHDHLNPSLFGKVIVE
ncbi:MAG: cupredoxin domain-containing protein [bacterium]|nr:cupredoxin domain-containing protein [bacterium]